MLKSKKRTKINVDIEAIHKPLVIEARTNEIVTSSSRQWTIYYINNCSHHLTHH